MTSTTTPTGSGSPPSGAATAASASSPAYTPQWPPPAPVGYLSRKALPIKRNDAEALTREDVQYDLLDHIFSNDQAVFTSPRGKGGNKVTFSTLYTQAIYHSSKCSKVLKDKMAEVPAFTIELAKISLLTNVGRINTTMAFFPEMKTALRTYHPVPSLQKTDGNAQDAPRIKNCLKAALIPSETKAPGPPSTPEEINQKRREGLRPPTSIVNLIFVLANHAAPLADLHFDGNFNFLDIFLPGKGLASRERAQIFLWLAWHYLESPSSSPSSPLPSSSTNNTAQNAATENPFADDYARSHPGKAPLPRAVTREEEARENVDTPEEIAWGRSMSARRNAFLQQLVSSFDHEKRTGRSAAPLFISVTPGSGSGRRSQRHVYDSKDPHASSLSTSNAASASFLYYVPKSGPNPLEGLQAVASSSTSAPASAASTSASTQVPLAPVDHHRAQGDGSPTIGVFSTTTSVQGGGGEHQHHGRGQEGPPGTGSSHLLFDLNPRGSSRSPPGQHQQRESSRARPPHSRHDSATSSSSRMSSRRHTVTMGRPSSTRQQQQHEGTMAPPYTRHQSQAPSSSRSAHRSMLDHAWILTTSTDPLDDSDGEPDSHSMLDYNRRLQVLSHLPKPPTAEDLGRSRIMRHFGRMSERRGLQSPQT